MFFSLNMHRSTYIQRARNNDSHNNEYRNTHCVCYIECCTKSCTKSGRREQVIVATAAVTVPSKLVFQFYYCFSWRYVYRSFAIFFFLFSFCLSLSLSSFLFRCYRSRNVKFSNICVLLFLGLSKLNASLHFWLLHQLQQKFPSVSNRHRGAHCTMKKCVMAKKLNEMKGARIRRKGSKIKRKKKNKNF